MGVEVNRLTAPTTMFASGARYERVPEDSHETEGDVNMSSLSPPSSPRILRLNHARGDSVASHQEAEAGSTGETAGIYLGILNLYTTLPQFVGTFISMIVFAIFEPGKSEVLAGEGGGGADAGGTEEGTGATKGGVNAIAVCLAIGAVCALGAAYATWRLRFVR